MAQRRRRKYGYKFTEKTQSKKGIAAFILAVLSHVPWKCRSVLHAGSTGRCGTGSDEPSGGGVF